MERALAVEGVAVGVFRMEFVAGFHLASAEYEHVVAKGISFEILEPSRVEEVHWVAGARCAPIDDQWFVFTVDHDFARIVVLVIILAAGFAADDRGSFIPIP